MLTARTAERLDVALRAARHSGRTVGFVPTMGALHAGHEALIRRCRRECEIVVASIFVNPLQFRSAGEYRRYPRSIKTDLTALRRWNVDVAYCPDRTGMSIDSSAVRVRETRVSGQLEGAIRPGHFEGVLTIVAKLFSQVRPDRAYFGEKDFQQLWLVRAMSECLEFGVKIVAVPTVRDRDGVALSSRNGRLSPAGRERAAGIHRSLIEARTAAARSRRRVLASDLISVARRAMRRDRIRPEYMALVDGRDFSRVTGPIRPRVACRLLTAATIESVHLIDNISIVLS